VKEVEMGNPVVHWELWSQDPQKVMAAGGKMIVEQQEVPGVGSLSLFEDPDGRVMGMWKQNR
jgi:predicted enzyme related to lactoylglutathione lyase